MNPEECSVASPKRSAQLTAQTVSALLSVLTHHQVTSTPGQRYRLLTEVDIATSVIYYTYTDWIDDSNWTFKSTSNELPALEAVFPRMVEAGADRSLVLTAMEYYYDAIYAIEVQRTRVIKDIMGATPINPADLDSSQSSPLADAIIHRINPVPDQFTTVYEFITNAQIVLGNCDQICKSYSSDDKAQKTNHHWIAELIAAGVITASEGLFVYLMSTDRSHTYRAMVPQLRETSESIDSDWKRELLVQSAVYSWMHHPQRKLDYADFAELAQDEDLQGTPASIVSMMMTAEDKTIYDERSYKFNTKWSTLCATMTV